ncbi:AraC family transcriptional regulator (plasmid) [Rhizobium leguminosarum]
MQFKYDGGVRRTRRVRPVFAFVEHERNSYWGKMCANDASHRISGQSRALERGDRRLQPYRLGFQKAGDGSASELLNGAITRDLEFDPVVDLTTARGSHLAALGNLVWSCLDIPGAHRFSLEAFEHLFQATMITLLRTVPNNCLPKVVGPLSPAVPWRLKRAIKYMDANLSRSMTVSAIAREAGTSVRALQVAFQRFKGTTPLNYLKTMRLEEARKALLADANFASISDVARNAGFTHMGRFSAAYYQAFGETPSDTIRKR